MKNIKTWIIGIIILTYAALLVIFSEAVSISLREAVMSCLTVIIPSLFAFMVISDFLTSTNLYKILSLPFDFPARYIFRIPTELFSVFLLSSFAGYPVGSRLISSLFRMNKIDRQTAEDMVGYCFLAGPAFICGIVGIGLFSSVQAGLLVFGCIFLANLLIAILMGIHRKIPEKTSYIQDINIKIINLTSSVYSGAKGMFSVCIMIVFFSSFICILNELNVITFLASFLSKITSYNYANCLAAVRTVIEISSIKDFSKGDIELLPLITALLSFGGICVVFQTESFINRSFSTKYFYIYRTIAVLLSFTLSKIMVIVFKKYEIIFVVKDLSIGYRQISPIPALFLLIMTILLLSNNYMAKS